MITEEKSPTTVENKETVKLSIKALKADKSVLTIQEMATKYGLSPAQMKLALKTAGIKLTRPKSKPKFELISDEEPNENLVV